MHTLNTEPIDIHRQAVKLQRELVSLANDQRLLPVQRQSITRFIADAHAGRLAQTRSKKRLSVARCRKCLTTLRRSALALAMPFEDVTVADMERFIFGLEDGSVPKLVPMGGSTKYTHDSVLDFKKILRKFYQWLFLQDEAKVKALTGWFDTSERPPTLHTFGLEQVQRMAMAANQLQTRALLWLLFDGGFRISELLNVRLHDVSFKPDADGVETCLVRIRVSKTKPRTISLPLATEIAKFWVERHPSGGRIRPDGTIDAKDPNAVLIGYTYNYAKKVLSELGRQELGERVHPHRFRHASATFYAKHLTEYQLKARFGWAMGSSIPQRYVDHSGVLAEDTASVIRREQSRGNPHGATSVRAARNPEQAVLRGTPLVDAGYGHREG